MMRQRKGDVRARKFWLGKKGYDFALVGVILGVVVIIVYLVVSLKAHTVLASEKDIETCRASVNTKSIAITFGSFGTRVSDPIDLNLDCHTTHLVVKKDSVEKYGVENQDGRTVTKFNEGKFDGKNYEDKLKTVIADSLENCWKMFGMGQIDAFTRLDGDKHCIMCYDIAFDKTAKEELQAKKDKGDKQTLDNFNQFLVDNTGSNRQTYAKYLYNVEPDEAADFAKDPQKLSNLSVNTQYAIIYYSARGNSIADAAAKAGEIVGCSNRPGKGTIKSFLGPFRRIVDIVDFVNPTCLGAKVVGFAIQGTADAFTHQVGVANVPIEKLKDQCTQLN